MGNNCDAGKNIANDVTLAGLGVGPTAMVQLEMQSADPINNPIKQFPPRQEYHMPDVITVRVQAGRSKVTQRWLCKF